MRKAIFHGFMRIMFFSMGVSGIILYLMVRNSILLLLPAIIISFAVAAVIAAVLAARMTKTIVKPLLQMAETMERAKDETVELEFEEYEYRELNIIAKNMERMSYSLKKYIRDIEFEKLVRQEFFTNVSHELKTPITSIRGFTELLQSGFAKDEETKQEFMSRIWKETDHMTHLINDILMISRLETKEIQETKMDLRISLLLQDVLSTFHPMMEDRKLKLTVECIPCVIHANAEQMKELLSNLVSNAIKYNKEEGSITIRVSAEQNDLSIEVSDTGIGIPESEKKRVFERFYRVDRARSKAVSGTGLGLSIVKHIVNYYQGSVILKTEEGKGSSFVVVLPNIIV